MVVGDNLVFRTAADQRYVSWVKKGNKATVYLAAYPGRSFEGEVIRIDVYVAGDDAVKTGQPPYTFYVWLSLKQLSKEQASVVSGMNGYCIIEYPFKTVSIPQSALMRYSGQQGMVMMVEKDMRITLKPITYSMTADGWIAVDSGVNADDLVIVSGQVGLQQGDRVSLQ